MRQSRVQKGARSKAQPPVAERPVEISRSKRRPHSQTPKKCRTEIRPRDCRRPRNTDSGSANDLRTNCAPCRRTLAAPTIHNRHSKKPEDCARAGSGKRQRRVIRRKVRQVNCRASVSDARLFAIAPVRRFTETPYKTTGLPSVITSTFFSIPCARAAASNRCGGSWSGSKPRGNVP